MRSLKLDSLDRRLLALLQADANRTNDQLAELVGRSPSAVQRRVQRLQASGVIERQIAIVDASRLGASTLLVVGLEVERERPELVQPLRTWLRNQPEVQQAYYVTGTADYVVLVTAPSIADFDEMMTRMMSENANVRRFTTNVVMTPIKRGLFVPTD